jgi:hydroxymethylpyrimidine kinase/phosphomethylpyrimidine kinase
MVLDTPIYSSNGHRLLSREAEKIVCEKLFPLATLITPNLVEASILSGQSVNDLATMQQAAVKLHAMGAAAVLIKGGHLPHQAIDLFYDGTRFETFSSVRIPNIEVHGTGCTLSSAIAALLAQGHSLLAAISQAKRFITEAILVAQSIGKGAKLLVHTHD